MTLASLTCAARLGSPSGSFALSERVVAVDAERRRVAVDSESRTISVAA
nr:hypothetical protein [Bradyrhizobium cosmicum]